MTNKNDTLSKDDKYNKGREPLFRVEIVKGDSPEFAKKMKDMKEELLEKSNLKKQSLKQTITDMHEHAKATGFFDKE